MPFKLKAGEMVIAMGVDDSKFMRGMGKVQIALKRTQHAMAGMSRVARNILIGGIGIGALSVRTAAQFEQSMARVQALTGATAREFKALEATARKLGETTVFTARQAAEAMGFFALAGFDANKIMKAMPATLNLAAAGQLEVAQAADIVAKIMAGMGITTDGLGRAVDVMAKAFTSANTDLIQLGEAMKFVGPIGKTVGKSLEELTASIMVMSNAGIQGSMAGTSLRMAISRLLSPSREVQKMFKKLNIDLIDSTGNMLSMPDIIDVLNDKLSLLGGRAAKTGAIMTIFGNRAGPAMAELLSRGGEELRIYQEMLESAGGTAAKIAQIQLDTFTGSLTLMKSALEGVQIRIGKHLIPTLLRFANHLKSIAGFINAMTREEFQALMNKVAALGKILIAIWLAPKLIAAMRGFILVLQSIPVAFAAIKTAIIALKITIIGSVGAMAAAFLGLVVVLGIVVAAVMTHIAKLKGFVMNLKLLGKSQERLMNEMAESKKKMDEAETKGEYIAALSRRIAATEELVAVIKDQNEAMKEQGKAGNKMLVQKLNKELAILKQQQEKIDKIERAATKSRQDRLEALRERRAGKAARAITDGMPTMPEITTNAKIAFVGLSDMWKRMQEASLGPDKKKIELAQAVVDETKKTNVLLTQIKNKNQTGTAGGVPLMITA